MEPGTVRRVGTALLVLFGGLTGFVLAEAGYRLLLYRTQPHHFLGDSYLWYFQASPFRYSEAFGFEYKPGTYQGGAVFEGRVIECYDPIVDWVINERGNSGRIKGSYENAELKILVFGDSVTQRPRRSPEGDYMTWADFLQDLLAERLGRSVHVVNFARDGYGVLQMFDLAAAKVRDWQPDLAIIALISDDLTRDRFWRTTTVVDGRERIMVSSTPDPEPDWDTATDAYLLHRGATLEWCQQNLGSGAVRDPIVRDLEATLREGRRRSTLLVNPWTLRQSFLVDRILRGDPFHSTYASARPSQLPRHTLRDFREDERMRANVQSLEASGVPYLLVHLAIHSELEREKEYVGRASRLERRIELVESLARLTGRPVHGTIEHADLPIENLEGLSHDYPADKHPSLRGHRFYAETVDNIVSRHGYVR